MALLKKTLARHPTDRDTLMALMSFSRDAGDVASALAYATRLEQLAPEPQLARLIEELRRRARIKHETKRIELEALSAVVAQSRPCSMPQRR